MLTEDAALSSNNSLLKASQERPATSPP